ncbi:T9SS type A sorting domain-containing protein [Chitinophaga sp. YIM B06452]|uniref:T9SS type A sorting domain-containing protein n=1 Tax=Chitinophaga sp. YIM B06452 TaxID=3082158 RepID=UPI0031FEE8A2
MKFWHLYFIFVILVFSPKYVSAQHNISFFSDTSYKEPVTDLSHIVSDGKQYIYAGGPTFSIPGQFPGFAIVKIDDEGKHIWSRTFNKEEDGEDPWSFKGTNLFAQYSIRKMVLDKDYLFVLLLGYLNKNIILALDVKTGRVVWKIAEWVNFPETFTVSTKDYISYIGYSEEHPSIQEYKCFDKHTGRFVAGKLIPGGQYDVPEHLEHGLDGAVYFLRDYKLKKYATPLLDSLCWTAEVRTPYAYLSSVLHGLREMENGDTFVWGDYYNGGGEFFIGSINPVDGSTKWIYQSSYFKSLYVADIKIKEQFIYLVINSPDITNDRAFHIVKIERATGKLVWDKNYQVNGENGYGGSGWVVGLNSIDVDDGGNAYVTGAEYKYSSTNGGWSVMKLDTDGNILYQTTLVKSSAKPWESKGLFTGIMNGRVVHVGNLNRGDTTSGYLVALDTGNVFNPVLGERVIAHHQEPGKVKKILPFQSSKMAILKQVGRHISLELRHSGTRKMLWSRDMYGERQYLAGGMAISTDNRIGVTVFVQDTSSVRSDYHRMADSIHLYIFDANGHEVFSAAEKAPFREYHTPLDLQAVFGNIFITSFLRNVEINREYYDFVNCFAFSENNAAGSIQPASYLAHEGKYPPVLQSYGTDSLMAIINHSGAIAARPYGYSVNSGKPQLQDGPMEYISLNELHRYNAAIDSMGALVLGRETESRLASVSRIRYSDRRLIWRVTTDEGVSLDKASVAGQFGYLAGSDKGELLIMKLDVSDGRMAWQTKHPAPAANQYYVVADQAFNTMRRQYVVCGYIADSSLSGITSKQPFYCISDTAGNIIDFWKGAPDLEGKNQLNAIAISQYGQTILGGSLYTLENNRAGVIIAADDIILPTGPEVVYLCSGTDTVLSAYLSGMAYQWQIDTGSGYSNLADGNGVADSRTKELRLSAIAARLHNAKFRCLVDNAAANSYHLNVNTTATPAIEITGETLIDMRTGGQFNATVNFGGDGPKLRWEDSTDQAGWTAIPGETGSSLSYMPAVAAPKIRCILISNTPCATTSTAVSNTLQLRINTVTDIGPGPQAGPGNAIYLYPNPAAGEIRVMGVQLGDHWEFMEIRSTQGQLVMRQAVKHQTNIRANVSQLPSGLYMLTLYGKNGKVASVQLVKI